MCGPPLDLPPFAFRKICPPLDTLGHVCPLFRSLAHSKGKSKNARPYSIQKTSGNQCVQATFPFVSNFFPSMYSFWELWKSFSKSPHSLFSFILSDKEGILSWAFFLFKPASSFSFVSFLVFHGRAFITSSTMS